MDLDVVLLSRLQFALTIMFHYLFPPLSIGLGLLLVIMEGMYLKTKNPVYEVMTKFWVKVFAITFGLGVASGIVMEFQFGTNWATYSRFVGDIFGSALAAEGIFAFFLESGFLAILVFGWNKVSPKMHFFSTVMVALGSFFSAIWIVVANSWMQTPAGYQMVGYDESGQKVILEQPFVYDPTLFGSMRVRAEITDFWEVVFNPSSIMRLTHTVIGAYILAAFVVMSISAFYILMRKHEDFAKRSFVIALILASVSSIAALLTGHSSGVIVAEHQPAKLAAMEGLFETQENAPLHIIGIPSAEKGEVAYGIEIPGGLSFLVHGNFKDEVKGLDAFPRDEWPPVGLTFHSFHMMVGLGMFFIGLTLFACFLLWRNKLFQQRWLMWVFVFAVILPYIANFAGWTTAEVGRQPWIVYGMLRTSDAVSKAVEANMVLSSIILFTFIYVLLFLLYVYILHRKIMSGPESFTPQPAETAPKDLFSVIAMRAPGQQRLAGKADDNNEEKE